MNNSDPAAGLEALRTLLDDFGRLPLRAGAEPTFMEIAGYPHYENVCSNLLAFFLDPESPHGLGTLLLDALMEAGDAADRDLGLGGNVSVEREVHTESGNRIDLLIESDTHVVLIENKLLAGISNPLDDYAEFAGRRGPRGATRLKILLSLFPSDEGRQWGFGNLTYAEFVRRIRSRLGHHASAADTRYLTLLLDFLNTLDNLQEGTRMNQDFVRLLSERQQDVENLLLELRSFKSELRQKVRELRGLIDVDKHHNVHQRYYREPTSLFDTLAHDITLYRGLTAVVDTYVEPGGWYIYIWASKGDPSTLQGLLERLEMPFERESHEDFRHHETFGFSEDLNRVSYAVQGAVDKLASVSADDVS